MSFLNNFSIKAKVAIVFGMVLVVTAGLGVFATVRLSSVNDAADAMRISINSLKTHLRTGLKFLRGEINSKIN